MASGQSVVAVPAINGAALYVSTDRFSRAERVRLMTSGSSWHTRMLIGALTITEGVPDDVDWTHVVRDIPATIPPSRTTPRSPR